MKGTLLLWIGCAIILWTCRHRGKCDNATVDDDGEMMMIICYYWDHPDDNDKFDYGYYGNVKVDWLVSTDFGLLSWQRKKAMVWNW